jgi:hypothetical protein
MVAGALPRQNQGAGDSLLRAWPGRASVFAAARLLDRLGRLSQNLAMEKVLLKAHDNIKHKCYTTTNPHYRDYGGRGITMHDP